MKLAISDSRSAACEWVVDETCEVGCWATAEKFRGFRSARTKWMSANQSRRGMKKSEEISVLRRTGERKQNSRGRIMVILASEKNLMMQEIEPKIVNDYSSEAWIDLADVLL